MAAVLQHSLASGADRRRQCVGDRDPQRLRQERHAADLSARPCSSHGERCEGKPTREGICPFPASLSGDICVASPRFPPSAKLLVANALMLAGGRCGQGLRGAAQGQLRRGGVPAARASTPSTAGSASAPKARSSRSSRRCPTWCWSTRSISSRAGRSPSTRSSPGREFFSLTRSRQELVPTMLQRTNHVGGVARGLSRDPAALCGALAGDGDRAAERGGRTWRRRAPARPRRACANAGGAPQGAAAAGGSHAAALQDGICGQSQGRVPEGWHDASVRRAAGPTSQA